MLVAMAVVALLVIWLGVPTFKKWRADQLVDELCAKDGGIKVYAKAQVPREKFDRWGQVRMPSKSAATEQDRFYYEIETYDIIGESGSTNIHQLTVFKTVHGVYRKADNKLLGKV